MFNKMLAVYIAIYKKLNIENLKNDLCLKLSVFKANMQNYLKKYMLFD